MPPLFDSLIAWASKMSPQGLFLSSLLVCWGHADGTEAEFAKT